MISKLRIFIIFLLFPLFFTGCTVPKEENSITISAAASLKEPLEEIGSKFESEKGIKVYYNFAGSGTLQKQIEEGAPVDLFISAGKTQMDALEDNKLIDSSTRKNLFYNNLVLVYSKSLGEIKRLEEIVAKNATIAIGEIKTVPAGEYAKQSFESLDIWEDINKNIIYAKSVKEVLQYVINGEVQAGVVYESDTVELNADLNVFKIDDNIHDKIIYPAALTKSSNKKEEANMFMNYILDDDNRKIFDKYKFKVMK